jgi:hypothetical protein
MCKKTKTLLGLYICLLVAMTVNVLFDYSSFESIRAGEFTEISGPGGHVIGKITAAKDPVDFWATIAFCTVVGGILLMYFIFKVIKEHRTSGR